MQREAIRRGDFALLRRILTELESLRLHASESGSRIAAWVSSVAGHDAAAAPTLKDSCPGWPAALRTANPAAVTRRCRPPMLS